jgi:Ca-activated chloride channel family protein
MDFSHFQFAQPVWLWGLLAIPLVALLYALFYRAEGAKLLERFADRHLLPHLVKSGNATGRTVRASLVIWVMAWVFGILAMAGPRWNYAEVRTFSGTRNLVIVLDLSQSMNATDVKPSRIARAREEIQDLLDSSRGLSVGLVAYAAVPHMVTPLTDDVRTIKNLLPALDTSLVTIQGDRLRPALEMAAGMLKAEPGDNKSILVISDGDFEEHDISGLARVVGKAAVYVMGIGVPARTRAFDGFGGSPQNVAGKIAAPPLKTDRLQSLAAAGHGLYVEANYTDSDTRAILGGLEASSAKTQLSPESARVWDERFYLPALALALLLLSMFRRGASFPAVILLAMLFFSAPPSYAAPLADLFLNRDQQGLVAYDKGDFKGAMTKFDTPYRRGIAAYRAGAYDKAASLFKIAASQKDGLNALYDLGNAQLMQGQVEDAIASYETVLKQKPGHVGARHNLAIALKMLAQNKDDNKKQNSQDKNNQGKSKQDQNKQQGRQQPQQQNKNGQRGSQSPQGGAQKPAQAKQSKDNQQAKQQQAKQQQAKQQQGGSQGKSQQQTGSQRPSPQQAKQMAGGKPQSPLTASYNAQQRTPRDVNADEWFGRVQSDPGSFLKNQFMIEDRKSGLKQGSPPE